MDGPIRPAPDIRAVVRPHLGSGGSGLCCAGSGLGDNGPATLLYDSGGDDSDDSRRRSAFSTMGESNDTTYPGRAFSGTGVVCFRTVWPDESVMLMKTDSDSSFCCVINDFPHEFIYGGQSLVVGLENDVAESIARPSDAHGYGGLHPAVLVEMQGHSRDPWLRRASPEPFVQLVQSIRHC